LATLNKLPKIIHDAFANSSIPSRDIFSTLITEGAELIFPNTQWTELHVETLKYHSASINFLTNKAFAYYLPAFMLAAFEDDGIKDSLMFKLKPPNCDSSRPSYAAWWSLLNKQQQLATACFINYFETKENT
jgi:hypothetical protein